MDQSNSCVIYINSSDNTSLDEAIRDRRNTKLLISDNRTAFTNHEFFQSVERNGICHLTSSSYHPTTNGLAERAVQVIKNRLRKNAEGDM